MDCSLKLAITVFNYEIDHAYKSIFYPALYYLYLSF